MNSTTQTPSFTPECYLSTLTEKEMKAYEIAKRNLGTSFQLEKSNGYLQWKKKMLAAASANETTQN
jgi:hypothetical protein